MAHSRLRGLEAIRLETERVKAATAKLMDLMTDQELRLARTLLKYDSRKWRVCKICYGAGRTHKWDETKKKHSSFPCSCKDPEGSKKEIK